MNDRSDQSVFVTRFAVFGAPGFVKIEAYDMEPTENPGTGGLILHKGTPVRMVMSEGAFEGFVNTLVEFRKNHSRLTQEPAVNALSGYAETARLHAEFRSDPEKGILTDIVKMLAWLGGNTDVKSLAGSLGKKLGGILSENLPEAGADLSQAMRDRFGTLFSGLSGSEASLFICLAGYVIFCEAGTASPDVASVAALLQDIAAKA